MLNAYNNTHFSSKITKDFIRMYDQEGYFEEFIGQGLIARKMCVVELCTKV